MGNFQKLWLVAYIQVVVVDNSACLHLYSESLAIGSHFLFSLRGEIPYFTHIRLLNLNFIQYRYVGSGSGFH
jgi:hypothetical protein